MRVLARLVLLAAAPAGAVQMYKCVDAKGVTHYTEAPLPGCKGKELDIQPQAPTSGTGPAPARDVGEQEREFRRRQLERGRAAEKDDAEKKRLDQRCQSLRNEHARYVNSRRVYQYDAKGERVVLDDAVRQKRVAELQEEISRSCR